jgi:serine/threonine-protein kinase HipA
VTACLICLGPKPPPDGASYHSACLRRLFRVETLPRLDLDLQHLPAAVGKELGKMSISGMQRKALLRLTKDKSALVVARKRSRYILKPQMERYAHVPENEHASMRIAKLAGVQVPPLGLFRLTDGSLAYLVKRYDRTARRKVHQVDLCQLAGRPAHERNSGSAEECAALVADAAGDPAGELRKLFRLLVVGYWIGDGDMHLKNVSMLRGEDGAYRLAPAYDLICTWIYGDTSLALPVGGKVRDVRRRRWVDFGEQHARLSRDEAEAILDEVVARTGDAVALLERSALPEALRKDYAVSLRKRSRALGKR